MEKKWPSDQTMDKAANDLAKLSLQGTEAAWQRLYKAIEECRAPIKAKNQVMWWLVTLQLQIRAPLPEGSAGPCCIVLSWRNPEAKKVLDFQFTETGYYLQIRENEKVVQCLAVGPGGDRDLMVNRVVEYLKRVFPEK